MASSLDPPARASLAGSMPAREPLGAGCAPCRPRTWNRREYSNNLNCSPADFGIDQAKFQPGSRVPWDGGEDYGDGCDAGRQLVAIHADLNAAQILERRFWTRHGDAYRIGAVEVRQGDQVVWYPDRDGVRLHSALASIVGSNGYARLVPSGNDDGFVLEPVAGAEWKRATEAGSRATRPLRTIWKWNSRKPSLTIH